MIGKKGFQTHVGWHTHKYEYVADPYDREEMMRRVPYLHSLINSDLVNPIFSKRRETTNRKFSSHSVEPTNLGPLSVQTGRFIRKSTKKRRSREK